MPHFEPDFENVKAHCPKPNCDRTFLHRHHIAHEAMWIHIAPHSWPVEELMDLANRYYAFLEEDIGEICAWHHAEIHYLYDLEIEKHQRALNFKRLVDYTKDEAGDLMMRLRQVYKIWIKKETSGIDPKYIEAFEKLPIVKDEMRPA